MRKGERTRRGILDAAIVRFGREGYRGTSVADIARDAGVGGTVAYAYFPSKEALFLAAVDDDAAAVIEEGLIRALAEPVQHLPVRVIRLVVDVLPRHPLAHRLLAGLEPEVSARVLDIPALAEVRKLCAERLRAGQLDGSVRLDVDAIRLANGLVTITLSLLRSVVQLGESVTVSEPDVAAVFEAAVESSRPLRC